jgi:hypothetical protein
MTKPEAKRITIYKGETYLGEIIAEHEYAVELGCKTFQYFQDPDKKISIYANGWKVW